MMQSELRKRVSARSGNACECMGECGYSRRRRRCRRLQAPNALSSAGRRYRRSIRLRRAGRVAGRHFGIRTRHARNCCGGRRGRPTSRDRPRPDPVRTARSVRLRLPAGERCHATEGGPNDGPQVHIKVHVQPGGQRVATVTTSGWASALGVWGERSRRRAPGRGRDHEVVGDGRGEGDRNDNDEHRAGAAWSDWQRGRSGVRPVHGARQRALPTERRGRRAALHDRRRGALSGLPGRVPGRERQYHTCHCCRHFVERFGGPVTIPRTAERPAILTPTTRRPSIAPQSRPCKDGAPREGNRRVPQQRADGASPEHGEGRRLTHLHIKPPKEILFRSAVPDAGQSGWRSARRSSASLSRAPRGVYAPDGEPGHVVACTDSSTEARRCSARRVGSRPSTSLVTLPTARQRPRCRLARDRDGAVRVLSPAPDDRNATEDIASGMDFDAASKRFAAKMHPLQYQRPQAAPTAGRDRSGGEDRRNARGPGCLARRLPAR